MRDFAKLKILEVSWQSVGNILVGALCTYNIVSFFFFFFCVCVLWGLMSAIGPEMTGVG